MQDESIPENVCAVLRLRLDFSATSIHKPGLHIWYQFRIETNGTWDIVQKFGPSNTVTLPDNITGTAVEAFALTQYQVQHKQWQSQVKASNSLPVSKVASISITGASTASTSAGAEILTVTAQDASGHVVANPGTATWTVTPTTGAIIHALTPGTSAAFTATAAGTYTVTVTLDGQTATKTMVVYDTPAAVKLSAASSSLIADGSAMDTLTATVVDSHGNPVGTFNGTIEYVGTTMGATASPATTPYVALTNGGKLEGGTVTTNRAGDYVETFPVV